MKKNNLSLGVSLLLVLIISVFASSFVNAGLVLDNIVLDPVIIAAGDEVDIIVQFHDESTVNSDDSLRRVNDPDYKFEVKLLGDDDLTKKYVSITDSSGDDVGGSIIAGRFYSKRFKIKVSTNAEPGSYEFKLVGQWYKNGAKEGVSQEMRFDVPVKKEGVVLDVTTIETNPAEVRPGDNFIEIKTYIENVGEKDAKSVEVNLNLPEGLESSYANENRKWIGRVNAGESKQVTFFIDVDQVATSKVYDIDFYFTYLDLDSNQYADTKEIPFSVKTRPYIEVVKSEGTGLAGASSKLYVTVKNTGTESAESVDVRLLKQNSQPFSLDVRSDYIGELEPGEEGVAIFNIGVNSEAEMKEHDFKILIRSKGDSDEGDDNIYTYNRRAGFDVTGKAPNKMLKYGLILGGIVVVLIIANMIFKMTKKKGKRK